MSGAKLYNSPGSQAFFTGLNPLPDYLNFPFVFNNMLLQLFHWKEKSHESVDDRFIGLLFLMYIKRAAKK
jgi:hypothetical protein